MKFSPITEYVTIDGNEELAIMIYAQIEGKDSTKQFVRTLIENFINHKMVSPPEVSILGVRIQGQLNVDEFTKEWKHQLVQNKAAMVFYERLTVIDATYESTENNITDLDIVI